MYGDISLYDKYRPHKKENFIIMNDESLCISTAVIERHHFSRFDESE